LLELIRVTAPGGHVIVQIPSTPRMGAPMVPEAYRAELSVLRAPTELTSGAAASIGVRITNTSDTEWPAEPLINLGNHWCGDGELLVVDDGRVEVPRPLGPGQSVEVNLTVNAPSAAGDHVMELDLVHEHLSWWADRGSSTLRVPIRVAVPAPSRPEPPNAGAVAGPTPADLTTETWRPAADMLMCGLHHQLVRQLVTHLDCWLLSAEQDELAGPEWISYTYVVAV
ncbi:MAG: hypothetical protein ACREX8_10495, partial [Gammaproteobacteria bacterium]